MENELDFKGKTSLNPNLSIVENTISAVVNRIVFRSNDEKFFVIRVTDRNNNERVLVGQLENIQEGEEIEAHGYWENHKEYGHRFRVTSFRPILPSTEKGIRRYLAGGVIPGVGPKLAERIVDKFGSDTLKVLDQYSSRLSEVSGFGKNRVRQIRQAWLAQTKLRDQYIFLQGVGISTAYCNRIVKKYGDQSVTIVSDNPYCLATEVKGIGFKMADSIARHLDIAKDNPFRLASGVVYVLQQLAEKNGHTCYPQDELIAQAGEILDVEQSIALEGLKRALADGAIVLSDTPEEPGKALVYSTNLYDVETQLAERIQAKLNFGYSRKIGDKGAIKTPQWATLNDAQCTAISAAFTNSISIITGGPGVGKTTVTREIVAIAGRENLRTALAAPTGRAAKRLSASSQCNAKTIHRLLKWEPEQGRFSHDEHHPLKVDMVIIDEVSMLDVVLAFYLLGAIALETNLVLIGDRDQLPSIGPGSFLADLIKSRQITVTHLTQVYRQSEHSRIITNAHNVNKGTLPDLHTNKEALSDFYWIEQDDPEKIIDTICRMVSVRIPERFNLSAVNDIQILTPMNHGLIGAKNLNHKLQEVLNPVSGTGQNYFQCGDTQFRVGDRVMQTTNNYDLDVFNGDLGVIHLIDKENQSIQVLLDTGVIRYTFEEADQLRLAYAITIHKSQGSEFPSVIVPVVTQHTIMLRRNLIYTAMTRASKLLILIGSTKALAIAVKNYQVSPRFTRLAERISKTST